MVIFEDGFETNDFSAWTGTVGAPVIVGAPVHHGSFAGQFNAHAEVARKTLSQVGTAYMKVDLQVSTVPSSNMRHCLFGMDDTNNSENPYLELVYSGATLYWALRYRNGAGAEVFLLSVNPAVIANTWYCCEIKQVNGTAVEFWINSVSRGSSADVQAVDLNECYVGTRHITAGSQTLTVDCVVVDSSRVTCAYCPSDEVLRRLLVGVGL